MANTQEKDNRMSLSMIVKLIILLIVLAVMVFVISLLELYTQLGRYKSYWNKQTQASLLLNSRAYVAFGDSAAQGVGATSPKKSYVALVADELAKKEAIRTINLSKSGGKIKDVLDTQLPEYKRLKIPADAIVTVEIGANDMISFNKDTFESEMDQLMSQLPKQAVISDIPYFGGSRFKRLEPTAVEANKIMYRLAEKHGFKLAKLHEKVEANSGLNTFAADWFHPSNYAYRVNWAEAFLAELR